MSKSGGISQSTQDAEVNVAKGELGLGQQANERSKQLFNTSFPGFATAENYYSQLASGDPNAIARAISPATQQINQQATGNKERITQDVPRGGAQNLALAENEINKGAQIGQAATQGYLSSFQNLAGLAGQGIGQGNQATGEAIGALSASGNQYSNIASQQAEGKAAQLGFISSLAGSAAELGAACWIAEALFGKDAYETGVIRHYLTTYAVRHWFGRRMLSLYQRYGISVAHKIYSSLAWRVAWLPLFEWLYRRAQRVVPEEEKRTIFERYWDMRNGVKA